MTIATSKTVTRATTPLKGKMKKVIRDEAKMLRLISGSLVGEAVIAEIRDQRGGEYQWVTVCKSAGHCAMGALMYAAGISNETIHTFECGSGDGGYYEGPVARKLFDAYHIDAKDASSIIASNDSVYTEGGYDSLDQFKREVKSRMDNVLDTISSLNKRERLRPRATA